MSKRTFVGTDPWLPWPLNRWHWMTEPVRAERLAALRIGVGIVLLLDVLTTYLPFVGELFGQRSLGSPEVFGHHVPLPHWQWSPFGSIEATWIWVVILLAWAVSGTLLAAGVFPRLAAATAFLLALCISNPNPLLVNSGNIVRNIMLFYLMLSPCGAVWSLWPRRRDASAVKTVAAWPLRLLFLQLVVIYFVGGITKLSSPQWQNGETLYYVLSSLDWTHIRILMPYWLTRVFTWATLAWEIGFPILVLLPKTRNATLWIGVSFHISIMMFLRVGPFGLYMLCMYLPLVAWESCQPRLAGYWPSTLKLAT